MDGPHLRLVNHNLYAFIARPEERTDGEGSYAGAATSQTDVLRVSDAPTKIIVQSQHLYVDFTLLASK